MTARQLQAIASEHGTPVVVIDHDIIRRNYAAFRKHLPKVQAYYAVKANPAPEIVRTLYRAGASFDVASLPEFMLVYENIRASPGQRAAGLHLGQDHLRQPDQAARKRSRRWTSTSRWSPTTTRASCARSSSYAPHAGLVLRLRVPNTGSMVELSSKFGCDPGEAVDLIDEAFRIGLVVEGLSFHVGSQCTNFENFVQALNMAAAVMREAKSRGHEIKILDIGGGFPVPYDRHVKPFSALARKINAEIDRLFPADIEILAEPGRFLVATAATSVARIIGKAVRDGKTCYYIDDSVYHTFSGIIFDHCQYHAEGFKKGEDGDLRRLRPDLRRAGHHLAIRGTAGPGDRRPGLLREHRRLQQRLRHLVQRLRPRPGGARQRVTLRSPTRRRLRGRTIQCRLR